MSPQPLYGEDRGRVRIFIKWWRTEPKGRSVLLWSSYSFSVVSRRSRKFPVSLESVTQTEPLLREDLYSLFYLKVGPTRSYLLVSLGRCKSQTPKVRKTRVKAPESDFRGPREDTRPHSGWPFRTTFLQGGVVYLWVETVQGQKESKSFRHITYNSRRPGTQNYSFL